jgi:two-component sensor histidine kinase/Tfp pilus assembly protein PilF
MNRINCSRSRTFSPKTNQYDSALFYYNETLKTDPRLVDSAAVFSGIGAVYTDMGFPNRSVHYYKQSIALYEQLNDTTNATINGYNLAINYKDLGMYDEALEISFNTLAKLERQKPDRPLASAYNTIGTVYSRIQDYEKAYDYYRKSLLVRLSVQYHQGVGQSYNNIGELFLEMGQYDSALHNLQLATSIRRKIDDNRGLGRTLTLIGTAHLRSGNIIEAKKILAEALSINRISNDNIGEVASLNSLGATFTASREFKLAEKFLDDGLLLTNKSGIREHLKRNLELHADLYRTTRNNPKLVNALARIMIVKDSLLNVEKVESLTAAEVQYETDKKQQEILLLQQQRKLDRAELGKNKIMIYSLSIGLLLVITIAILAYRIYRQTRKEKIREKESADLHMKEVHHRFKNHLQILSSIFTIQAAMLQDKKAQEMVRDIESRVSAMGLLHKKLYKGDAPSAISLKEYITELTQSLLFSYGFDAKLKLDMEVVELKVNIESAVRIGLIVNELITNALKYAYTDHPEPRLKVLVARQINSLRIAIADNGNKPFSADEKKSFGLQMVKSLVKELKGQIEVSATAGTAYSINIPQ